MRKGEEMSRTKKGGKPLGWEYWGRRAGSYFLDRHDCHKRERAIEREMINNLPKYHEPNKIGYDGTHEHPDIVHRLQHLGIVKVWVNSNSDYISINGKFYRDLDEWYLGY